MAIDACTACKFFWYSSGKPDSESEYYNDATDMYSVCPFCGAEV